MRNIVCTGHMGLAGEIDGMRFLHIGLEEGLSHSTIFESIRIKKAICGLPLMTDLINMTVIILHLPASV